MIDVLLGSIDLSMPFGASSFPPTRKVGLIKIFQDSREKVFIFLAKVSQSMTREPESGKEIYNAITKGRYGFCIFTYILKARM